jgi:hypothetical protein
MARADSAGSGRRELVVVIPVELVAPVMLP